MKPVWDESEFKSNFSGLEEFGIQTIQNFFQILPEFKSELKKAIDQKIPRDIEISAHKLVGVIATFYAEPSRNLAFRIEQIGRSGELRDSATLFSELEAQLELLIVSLQDFVNRGKAS
jgi:HPt (histidine-containing phosphotransfer) domain-containing protein